MGRLDVFPSIFYTEEGDPVCRFSFLCGLIIYKKGYNCMLGGMIMEVTIPMVDTPELLKELDKGIEDLENGRVTSHEETMNLLTQRYSDYVSQNSGN